MTTEQKPVWKIRDINRRKSEIKRHVRQVLSELSSVPSHFLFFVEHDGVPEVISGAPRSEAGEEASQAVRVATRALLSALRNCPEAYGYVQQELCSASLREELAEESLTLYACPLCPATAGFTGGRCHICRLTRHKLTPAISLAFLVNSGWTPEKLTAHFDGRDISNDPLMHALRSALRSHNGILPLDRH
jgi:hypothetical protein